MWVILRVIADGEQCEDALLKGRGSRVLVERQRALELHANAVLRQRGQVGQQGSKTVHWPAVVRALLLGLALGARRALGGLHHRRPLRFGGGPVVVVEQQGSQVAPQMPLDVVSQHAQEHMCPHAIGQMMVDRPHVYVGQFQAAEPALHVRQKLVASHGLFGGHRLGRHVRTDHVDAVQRDLGRDRRLVSLVTKRVVGDFEVKVLGHFTPAQHATNAQGDLRGAPQRGSLARSRLHDLVQFLLAGQQ